MKPKDTARHVLETFSPPHFANPEHREKLHGQLAIRAAQASMRTTPGPTPRSPWRPRLRLAAAVTGAAVIALAAFLALAPPENLFARALKQAARYPVVHYRLMTRAMANTWGIVFDPRQPLTANAEVWIHLGKDGAPQAVRYDSGLTTGDRFERLIRDGEIVTYKPAVRWAWKMRGDPTPFLRLGPLSILTTARALDRKQYAVHHGNGELTAVAVIPPTARPAGRVPVRLNELKTRDTFVFDAHSGLLRRVTIEGFWQHRWITLAKISNIQYLDFDPAVFRLALAPDTVWSAGQTASSQPNGETPEETAKTFLHAWISQDKATLRALGGGTPYDALLDPARTGSPAPVAVVSVGSAEHDPDGIYPGVWIPYAVRFPNGNVRHGRLALKQNSRGSWFVNGGV
ncbi:MAG: hypothetical protein GXP48_00315 [Acidobacteria bacterium]|nr:hypothetical protein [Acidobacteriota bacterium]